MKLNLSDQQRDHNFQSPTAHPSPHQSKDQTKTLQSLDTLPETPLELQTIYSQKLASFIQNYTRNASTEPDTYFHSLTARSHNNEPTTLQLRKAGQARQFQLHMRCLMLQEQLSIAREGCVIGRVSEQHHNQIVQALEKRVQRLQHALEKSTRSDAELRLRHQKEVKDMEYKYQGIVEEYKELVESVSGLNQKLTDQIQMLTWQIGLLRQQLITEGQRRSHTIIEDKSPKFQTSLSLMSLEDQGRQDILRQKVTQLEQLNYALENQLNKCKAQMLEYKKQIHQYQTQVHTFKQQLQHSQQQSTTIQFQWENTKMTNQNMLNAKILQIQQLQTQNQQLYTINNRINVQLRTAIDRQQNTANQLQVLQSYLNQTKQSLSRKTRQYMELQILFSKKQMETQQLRSIKQEFSAEIKSTNEQLSVLKRRHAQLQEVYNAKVQEIDTGLQTMNQRLELQKQIHQQNYKSQFTKLLTQYEQAKNQTSKIQNQVQSLKLKQESLSAQKLQLTAQIKTLNTQVAQLKSRLNIVQDRSILQLTDKQSKISDLEMAVNRLSHNQANYALAMQHSKCRIQQLQALVEQLKEKVEYYQPRLQSPINFPKPTHITTPTNYKHFKDNFVQQKTVSTPMKQRLQLTVSSNQYTSQSQAPKGKPRLSINSYLRKQHQ